MVIQHMAKRNSKLTPSGLTIKQDKFVNNYIETGNGTQSAIAAGYNPNSAYSMSAENLTKPVIASAILNKMNKNEVTCARVLKVLSERLDSEDDVIALKAAELAGKHLRMFTDKVDHTVVFDKIKEIGWSDGDNSAENVQKADGQR